MSRRPLRPPTRTIDIDNVSTKHHGQTKFPPSLDLIAAVAAPTNQGGCGSCWAITSTQCVEDRINRARGGLPRVPTLSYYLMTRCARNCITYNNRTGCPRDCNGGFLVSAYLFLKEVGTVREAAFPNPHAGEDGMGHIDRIVTREVACPRFMPEGETVYTCDGYYHAHIFPELFGITNARAAPPQLTDQQVRDNADNIAREVYLNGPVAVCFNLFSDFKDFWLHPRSKDLVYEIGWELTPQERSAFTPVGDVQWTKRSGPSGIYFKTGHSVAIVGYGTQRNSQGKDVDYWICRNSWGRPSNTFRNGFFKIRRGVNCSAIEGDVAAPLIKASQARALVPSTAAPAPAPSPSAPAQAVQPWPPSTNPPPDTVKQLGLVLLVVLVVGLTMAATVINRPRRPALFGADGLWREE